MSKYYDPPLSTSFGANENYCYRSTVKFIILNTHYVLISLCNMKINEIFTSIQGETSFAGLPFTFVRLTGCNLLCSYCDTQYAYEEGTEWSIDRVMDEIQQKGISRIVVTGGEPLLQNETPGLCSLLAEKALSFFWKLTAACRFKILIRGCTEFLT